VFCLRAALPFLPNISPDLLNLLSFSESAGILRKEVDAAEVDDEVFAESSFLNWAKYQKGVSSGR